MKCMFMLVNQSISREIFIFLATPIPKRKHEYSICLKDFVTLIKISTIKAQNVIFINNRPTVMKPKNKA